MHRGENDAIARALLGSRGSPDIISSMVLAHDGA